MTYNQPITTKWLLLSLLDQKYSGEVELLICNDGSTTDLLPSVRSLPNVVNIWMSPKATVAEGRAHSC